MPAEGAAEGGRYLTHRGVIDGFLKTIHVAERGDPTQLAFGLFQPRVFAYLCGYSKEILGLLHGLLAFLDGQTGRHTLADEVDFLEGSGLSGVVGIHRTLNGDVGCAAVAAHMVVAEANEAVECLIVLHVLGGSLCAIGVELLKEGCSSVQTGSLGFGNLQLEVDEHIHVFVHAFLISGVLAVLGVDVQEFRGHDGLAVNGQ